MKKAVLFLAVLGVCAGVFPSQALAAGKKPQSSSPSDGKRVVQIDPVYNVRIEMPDQEFHDFGEDFQTSLSTRLIQSGRYVLGEIRPQGNVGGMSQGLRKSGGPQPSYDWPGTFVPAARVTVKVEALSFQTGGRGGRMFYGFNERFRTPFNSGYESIANEFPLKENAEDSDWFDGTFGLKGTDLFGSRAGLDLGDGFELNVLFAWMSLKYALYRSELRLRLDIDAPLGDRREFRLIQVVGKGFFFDVAGAYAGYSAAIRIARKNAMGQALKDAIDGAYGAIDRALQDLPLTARIDSVLPNGTLLLGTGYKAEVKPGVRYQLAERSDVLIEVVSSEDPGAVARVVYGDPKEARVGAVLKQYLGEIPTAAPTRGLAKVSGASASLLRAGASRAEPSPDLTVPAAVEQIELPWKNLKRPKIDGVPFVSELKAFLRSLGELVFLPYRIARYFMYDQSYHQSADRDADDGDLFKSSQELADERNDQRRVTRADDWAQRVREEMWARSIGLSNAPEMEGDSANGPIVAVIDTGVDYNHPAMHERLWFNPSPIRIEGAGIAGGKDYYGWDFISGDPHAFDDAYHGTEVASLVSGVAPKARIMPLKVFNPWGVTSSAAIYGAFEYAVTHGAQVILCAWATHQSSEALRLGIELARTYGALVVVAAGDQGEPLSRKPSYPAVYSARFSNVLTVAALNQGGGLLQGGRESRRSEPRLGSNFGAGVVGIAAPGERIRVATPRNRYDRESSSAMAAAIVAGAAAREFAAGQADGRSDARGLSPQEVISRLESQAERVPALAGAVRDGLSLRVR